MEEFDLPSIKVIPLSIKNQRLKLGLQHAAEWCEQQVVEA